jgi:DNA mismatch endonuclease (patch repair protein)
MTDNLSKLRRSANMRAVPSRNTGPEIRVRQIAHSLGYRFRLHSRSLPGKPDIVFPSRQKVIFVHGCFWHQHKGCSRASLPQTNSEFWRTKLSLNAARDSRQMAAMKNLGWRVLVVWECEIRNERRLEARLRRFLG